MLRDAAKRPLLCSARMTDLILRSIAKRCVSKDGRNARDSRQSFETPRKSAAPQDEVFETHDLMR
jgi:hypothetical protein